MNIWVVNAENVCLLTDLNWLYTITEHIYSKTRCHIPRLLDAEGWHTGLFVTAHGSARTFRRRDGIHILISIHGGLRYLYFFTNKECVEPKMKHLLLQRKKEMMEVKKPFHFMFLTNNTFIVLKCFKSRALRCLFHLTYLDK
jgi:hypothetical protein